MRSIAIVVKLVAVKIVPVGIALSVFFLQVELDGIESDDDQSRTTFLAIGRIALFDFGVDINFFTAFGTNRGWHFERISETYDIGLSSRKRRVKIGLTFNLT